jgi:hypothetical protein
MELQEITMEVQPKDTSKGHFYVSLVKSGFRILQEQTFVLVIC